MSQLGEFSGFGTSFAIWLVTVVLVVAAVIDGIKLHACCAEELNDLTDRVAGMLTQEVA